MESRKAGRPKRHTEEMIRMNINLPKSFYKKIKQKALDEETTVTEIVIKALEKYLH